MIYNAKESKLKADNKDIDYISFGKGKKYLIMIQGLNTRGIKGFAYSLAYMYRIFAKEYKVYLFDRRKNISDGITVRELASDIALAMDTLGIKNADILGVSQGGMIAEYLAIDRPDLVNKLVLALTLSKNNQQVETVVNSWIEMTQGENTKSLIYDMANKMYSDSYIKKYKPFLPLLALIQKPKDKERFICLAKACLTCNTYDELYKIKCPVFVIGARQDKIVGENASREIAEKLGCKLYIYENLGHAAYEEDKNFNKMVYEFFKNGN